MAKERLDLILVNKGYFPTRQQAQRAVMAGLVRVNGERADKPGTRIPPGVEVEVAGPEHPYVSRGGIKLEQALKVFRLDLGGRVVLDVGASTGGFNRLCPSKWGSQGVRCRCGLWATGLEAASGSAGGCDGANQFSSYETGGLAWGDG